MKKNFIHGRGIPSVWTKTIRLMKLICFFFFVGLLQVSASVYSQTKKLTLDINNKTVLEVLDEIEKQSEFRFAYSSELIDLNRRVTVDLSEKSIDEILGIILEGTGVAYTLHDRHIMLYPKELGEISKLSEEFNQQNSVSGKVTDRSGTPLPGVTVVVKGTTNGTVTDVDGEYTLAGVTADATLQFSFVGMKTQEIFVGDQSRIEVQMEEETIGLEEVVAIGYGTQSKRYVTGAISSVDMTVDGRDLPNTNITQSISNIPGIQFKGDGRPGQDGSILIRGQNSLSGDNSPLIVLDGIIFSGSLSDINPQDIKKIDVLKDASSATVYGSRAANGVILITSKKGTTEKPTVRLNTFYGISSPSYEVKMLSPERYIERRLDWREQQGLEADPNNIASYLTASEATNFNNGISHDNWDVIYQDASIYTVDLSVSARTNFINYYLSASTSEEKGLVYNDNQKRNTIRANVSSKISEWLSIGMDATFSYRDLSGVEASVGDAYRASPFSTYFYPDGEPTQYSVEEEQAGGNPLRNAILTKNEEIKENLFSNFYFDVDIPFVKGLAYRLNYSPNLINNHNYNYVRQDQHLDYNNTSARKYIQKRTDLVWENIVTYDGIINDNNAFDLTFLYGQNKTKQESTTAVANQLSIDGLGYNNLGLGNILTNSSNAWETEGVSLMGRLNYRLLSKYFFTFTVRRDGSSVFAKNNKYATFPSGSFAWILSDESFVNSKNIDLLKLRLSYGSVGNQAIQPYQSLSLSDIERYVFNDGGSSSVGVITSVLGNDDLKWETTYSANIALDFELFRQRLGGTLELYNSKTQDLLVQRSIPVMNGYSSILSNIGETQNKGIEITLNSVNIQNPNFTWSSNLTFAYNKNEIKSLYGTDLDGDGEEDSDIGNSWFIGYPITSYYDYVFDGIYQEGDNDIPVGSEPGFVKVKDINPDGEITPDDRKVVGSGGQPKYTINLRNNLTYNNFTFSIQLNSMLDWMAPFNLINPRVPGRALSQIDAGWWTSENQSNTRPSLNYSNPLGTNWYISRNFLRIKDISLGYDFREGTLNRFNLSALRIYVSAKNLYTFTNWLGTDPESGGDYYTNQSADLYPMPRTFAIGLNIAL